MLHYSRKEATGEIHDPISFKPLSEHSHIVAIATTGNVFLAESIKGGMDLVAEVPFKKWVLQPFASYKKFSIMGQNRCRHSTKPSRPSVNLGSQS